MDNNDLAKSRREFLLKKLVDDPSFAFRITPTQMFIIGYFPSEDENWPSHRGLLEYAKRQSDAQSRD
jgi:hypothetical protein